MHRNKITLLLLFLLTACGGGTGDESVEPIAPPPNYPTEGTVLEEYCEDPFTKVVVTADGQGGENTDKTEDSEECGYEPLPVYGTPISEPYCASSLPEERFLALYETITHLLKRDDLMQDFADGEGGSYTERVKHVAQECWEQYEMDEPDACPTDYSPTGDPRFDYLTCDGVKQKTSVSFPYTAADRGIAIIDILIAVDTRLEVNAREFAQEQVDKANHYFLGSDVDIRLRITEIWEVEAGTGDLRDEYPSWFYSRGRYAELDQKQIAANADFAFLFRKRPENPIACGVAQLDATRGIDYSRGITQCFIGDTFQETASTRYYERAQETFVHEVGHLLGLEHEWKDAANVPIFEFGYAYNIPGYEPRKDDPEYQGIYSGYGTIMSYADLPTNRFSDRSVTCYFPEDAGEYAGQAVKLGTEGGCFCLDPIENQPPPTDAHEHLQRVRYLMSQLAEKNHDVNFSPTPLFTEEPVDICLF